MSTPDALIADRYRLVRPLGSGGMGVVWEAWDERLERRVALKQLRDQPGLTPAEVQLNNKRAMREARNSARLHHRYAVPVFDVVEHDGRPCLIMQFLPSVPLSELLRESGPLRPAEAARVGDQVGSALAAAHQAGIVHRDVKPGNILVADDGTALISDFGISQALEDATLTTTGMVHGTPAYLAPEVARGGPAGFSSDVFSLGATLYATLEGAPPFGTDANSIALLYRVAAGSFDPPQRSGPLTPVLVDMLSTDPNARPTMAEVARRFAALDVTPAVPAAPAQIPTSAQDDTPVRAVAVVGDARAAAARPMVEVPEPPRPRTRARALAALAIVLAVAVVVTGLAVWRSGGFNRAGAAPAPVRSQVSTAPATSAPPPAATSTDSRSTTPPASAPPTPTRSATTPASTPKKSTPAASRPTGAELARAISDYYALMPDDTNAGWPRLTSSYQQQKTGGRNYYNQFWGAIRKVSATNVTGHPPDRAEATITYTYAGGKVARERTSYGLVKDGGKLKINSSEVLQSTGG